MSETSPTISGATHLVDVFNSLRERLAVLGDAIQELRDKGWQTWFLPEPENGFTQSDGKSDVFARTAEVYNSLEFEVDGIDPRHTWQLYGLIAIPKQLISLADEVNVLKELFLDAENRYCNEYYTKIKRNAVSRSRAPVRDLLSNSGFSRVHLKQCVRRIIVVDEKPEAISLSWVQNKKSITRISYDKCLELLNDEAKTAVDEKADAIAIELSRLEGLSQTERGNLRLVQDNENRQIRVQAYFRNSSAQQSGGGDIKKHFGYLSMPALVYNNDSRMLPPHTELAPLPSLTKRVKKRSDTRLGRTPFLPSCRVFLLDWHPS